MMLMLSEYKCVYKYSQDPSEICGYYKHINANRNQQIELLKNKQGTYDISVIVEDSDYFCPLGQGTLHKSPLLGDYIEFEIGVMLC